MSCNITIPPFPSQDLAKLVLGYLAEEQLMTAYDEFLQASPYLDALQNEYDRIFMTSLKNILAEYRAVKIYVETCKPFLLRRKLVQCNNLLEIVKFLISNVDINKLHIQESNTDKAGLCRQSCNIKTNVCDVCTSLTLPNCVCRTPSLSGTSSQSSRQIDESALESSVETTSLADLPGNITYKKKTTKQLEGETNYLQFISSSDQITSEKSCPNDLHKEIVEEGASADNVISSVTEQIGPLLSPSEPILVKDVEIKPKEVVQDSNNISNFVSNNRNGNICKDKDSFVTNNVTCKAKRICNAGSFQDFATGVGGDTHKVKPDSSTSENFISQTSTNEVNSHIPITNIVDNVHDASKSQFILKVGNTQNIPILPQKILPRLAKKESHVNVAISLKGKPDRVNSPKITILSDIKVDKDIKMPPILKNATSTPLIQMQTLFINETPAYKQKPQVTYNYTKDEIMAMPTIILVPSADPSKNTVPTLIQSNVIGNRESTVNTSSSTGPTFGPLVIDVSASNTASVQNVNEMTNVQHQNIQKLTCESGLLKTADVTSHASLPKDNALSMLNKTSTPQVPPPMRKSSSTPRRTSHVRVLDFTTPRRILHETINEQVANTCSSDDVVSNSGPSLPILNADNREDAVPKIKQGTTSDNQEFSSDLKKSSTKENKAAVIKTYNWDAELRALAVANGPNENSGSTQKPKPKKIRGRISPKNKSNNNVKGEKSKIKISNKKTSETKKKTPKVKSLSAKNKPLKVTDDIVDDNTEEQASVPIKPTINIICANKWSTPAENDKCQNKSNNSEERIDTPELESMSLQNEIGAKLNISDLLETPYKQALYDIQMETPRFACPDIPGEPMSDIKIMNIPTPKYLNTPKVLQNTPSSYSSRPTDYSSGGSYYKPDDQDYELATEVLECALSVSEGTSRASKDCKTVKEENVIKENVCEGKSRPVRQCTKNVSYYSSPSVSNKIKEVEDNLDKSSTCSDTSIIKCTEKKVEKYKSSKSAKDSKLKEKKSDIKKNFKKYKSPVKKELPKTFMKIKPRRTTPIKESLIRKGKKKLSECNQNANLKPQSKKRTSIKEKNNIAPIIAAAPTKSRRKSSTPRKIHCTKIYNSENSVYNSPEPSKECGKQNAPQTLDVNVCCNQDSDTEQLPLRWSDDGSQDSKPKESDLDSLRESEDISKIKEYINTTIPIEACSNNEGEGTLHVDLIKRGFDIETARMIERDLLETSTQDPINHIRTDVPQSTTDISDKINYKEIEDDKCKNSNESDSSKLQITQDEDDRDDFDLSVYECNEETENFIVCNYNEATFVPTNLIKLKEKFSMEICTDDDLAIRLRATPFNIVFEKESNDENISDYNEKHPEKVISPKVENDNLYTPRKAQVYELFDSTLTSLDTPLKIDSPKVQEYETTVTEIVLEVEKLDTDINEKPETKKRKRRQSGNTEEISNSSKKPKPDAPYILNSTSIQNIDIESVLSKLHGP